MANKATYLRVGLLLIAGTAAVIGLVLFLSSAQVRGGIDYETYFRESVQGLDVGAPVKFRGVTLGQVTSIGLVTAVYMSNQAVDNRQPEARLVVVRWKVDPKRLGRVVDQDSAIAQGLRARLASQGLTGLAYVELDFVDPQRFPAEKVPWTPEYYYVPSMPSTFSQVSDAVQGIVSKLQNIDFDRIATGIQTVLNDVHTQLTSGDAKAALADTAGLAKSLRAAVEAADLPGLAADLRSTLVAARGNLDSKDPRSLAAAATQAAERLAAASARLPPLIAALEATVKRADAGTSDIQADIVPVLRDARAAAANLRETSETLRRYPASVLLGGPPPNDSGSRR